MCFRKARWPRLRNLVLCRRAGHVHERGADVRRQRALPPIWNVARASSRQQRMRQDRVRYGVGVATIELICRTVSTHGDGCAFRGRVQLSGTNSTNGELTRSDAAPCVH
jgi:hypothetical protein